MAVNGSSVQAGSVVAAPLRAVAAPAFINKPFNPYQWLLYTAVGAQGVVVEESPYQAFFDPTCPLDQVVAEPGHILHLHWPEYLLYHPNPDVVRRQMARLFGLLDRLQGQGTALVWTAHNLQTHESADGALHDRFWRELSARLDGYIALTERGREQAIQRHPALTVRPGFVIPHGHYRAAYPNTMSRIEARAALGISPAARVLAFVGQIRPYKGVPELLAAFGCLPAAAAVLLIAGQPHTADLAAAIGQASARDPRVRYAPGFVPAEAIQRYLNAADLVVLPFRDSLNSGSAILSLSFDRPLLVPLHGAMPELQAQVGADWVRSYAGACTTEVLAEGLAWALGTQRGPRAPLDALAWGPIAQQTAAAYRAIWARRHVAWAPTQDRMPQPETP